MLPPTSMVTHVGGPPKKPTRPSSRTRMNGAPFKPTNAYGGAAAPMRGPKPPGAPKPQFEYTPQNQNL